MSYELENNLKAEVLKVLRDDNEAWLDQHFQQGDFDLDTLIMDLASVFRGEKNGEKYMVTPLFAPVIIYSSSPLNDLRFDCEVIEEKISALFKNRFNIYIVDDLKSASGLRSMGPLDIKHLTECVAVNIHQQQSMRGLAPMDPEADVTYWNQGYVTKLFLMCGLVAPDGKAIDLKIEEPDLDDLTHTLSREIHKRNKVDQVVSMGRVEPYRLLEHNFLFQDALLSIQIMSMKGILHRVTFEQCGFTSAYTSDYAVALDGSVIDTLTIPDMMMEAFKVWVHRFIDDKTHKTDDAFIRPTLH